MDNACTYLTRPLVYVIFIEIKSLGTLMVREIAPHTIPAQYPHAQGLMRPGTEGVRQIVKAALAGLAHGALALGLRVIRPWLRHCTTITPWTTDPVWPT